ncbi:hypothetical protein Bca4012_093102 [Brassica carinata]
MLSIDDTLEARQFFKSWSGKVFQHKPKSILVISAHWDTEFPSVNTVLHNSTIHDFNGFPDPMYKLKYEAPGAIALAKRVRELLMGGGMKRVDEDTERGLDHGAWVPLMLMYPDADIPVCQLSVQSSQTGTYHYNMGKALAPLKEEGVLIIGSGSATHNLRKLDFSITNGSAVPWALEFDHWLRDSLLQGRYKLSGKRKLQMQKWHIHGQSISTHYTLPWVQLVMMRRQSKSTQAGNLRLCLILLIASLLPFETFHLYLLSLAV